MKLENLMRGLSRQVAEFNEFCEDARLGAIKTHLDYNGITYWLEAYWTEYDEASVVVSGDTLEEVYTKMNKAFDKFTTEDEEYVEWLIRNNKEFTEEYISDLV